MFALPMAGLIVSVLILVVCGAGSFTWATGLAACVLAGVALTVVRGRHVFPVSRARTKALPGVDTAVLTGLVLVTLTVVPLPVRMSGMFGPVFHEQNEIAATAALQAAELELVEPFAPRFGYSRNRVGTRRTALILAVAFLAAALSAHFSVKQKTTYLLFLALLGAGLAVAGLLALTRFPQGDTLWWRIPVKHGLPGPVACFINRNYFAGCMAILCAATGGLVWYCAHHRRWACCAVSTVCVAVMSIALVAALSRGAIVAYAAAAGCFLFLLLVRRRWMPALILLLVVILAATVVLGNVGDETRDRLQSLRDPLQTASAHSRLRMWEDTLAMWSAHPLAGVGLDGFRMVYPQYRTTSRSAFASHAENLYVQALADTGLIGVVIVCLLAIAIVRLVRSPTVEHAATNAFLPASAAAVVAAGVHSAFDSPLLIPLNTLLTASILGLSLSMEEGVSEPAHVSTRPLSVLYASLIAVWFGVICIPMHRADSIRFCRTATATELARALQAAPSSWMHWYYLGRRACLTRTRAGREFGEHCISRAAELDPNNYKIWRELGELRLRLGDRPGAAAAFRRVRELGRDWVNLPKVPGHNYELPAGKGGKT